MPVRHSLWFYSHTLAIFSAVLLFTARLLCVLLWNATSSLSRDISTFTYDSPALSTFSITRNVALFGAVWNTILFVAQMVLERDTLPISTESLRYEIEREACVVTITGNAVYSVVCLALMATLARLAADAGNPVSNPDSNVAKVVASSAGSRRAGLGVTAAMAGIAAAAAVWACVMDVLHMQNSRHKRNFECEVVRPEDAEEA